MANNKIQLGSGEVLIDLSGDTLTPDTMLEGVTGHDAKGEPIIGTYKKPTSETWTFEMEDGSTVEKQVYVNEVTA